LLHCLDAALGPAFGIVLALGPQQVGLHRLRRLDQGQQASRSRREGAISKQSAHQAVLPQPIPGGTRSEQLSAQNRKQRLLEGIELARPQPAAGFAAGRSEVCSTLQLRPVPGSPTVVRGPPLRLTGMLNEAPRPPTEIELRPPLAKLKRSGPRRAERRKRKPMVISGS